MFRKNVKNMFDLQEIYKFQQLRKLLKTPKDYDQNINFTEYSPVYLETNEVLEGVFKYLDVASKDVCCVTSSGDFALNAIALGAKSVTTFDINKYAKYILALKIAAIKTYVNPSSYEEFLMRDNPKFLDYGHFQEVRGNLSSQSFSFWQDFYNYVNAKKIDLQASSFFRGESIGISLFQSQYNPFMCDNNYRKLRKNLGSVLITTYDMDITKLPTLSKDHQFDIIYLSNILQYYKTINGLETPEQVHTFLERVKAELTRSGGIIGVDYCYWHNLIKFYPEFDDKICDISNYLITKWPKIYGLYGFRNVFQDMEDGLCLTRKR